MTRALLLAALVWCLTQSPAVYRYSSNVPLPDSTVTPGAVATTDTAIVCHRSTKTVRHTTEATKKRVYLEYGIRSHKAGEYEIDHLIPLELGGADTITNLWPQPAEPEPGFHQKDKLENELHRLACSGRIPLSDAQRQIAHDWWALYKENEAEGWPDP